LFLLIYKFLSLSVDLIFASQPYKRKRERGECRVN